MEPILFNNKIPLSKGLTWKKQLDKLTNKTYRAFWTCQGTFGKTCGLKPKVMYWIYTMVVRPIVTYAEQCGGLGSISKQARLNLEKLQRMACLGITGAMKTAPTAVIVVLLGLPHCP
jgi:hypothetical protein